MPDSTTVSQVADVGLALLVLFLTPVIALVACFQYAAIVLISQRKVFSLMIRGRAKKRTVLITGTNEAFGLNLARSFHRAGTYRVIGADLKTRPFLSIAKKSQAISRHYDVPQFSAVRDASYIGRYIARLARNEAVSLWIDCSQDLPQSVISIVQKDLEQKAAVCFTRNDAKESFFQNRDSFLEFLQSRNLPTPEHHKVHSRGQIHNVINSARGAKRFLLTSPGREKSISRLPLPSRTASQTYSDISKVKIQPDSFFYLDEEIDQSTTEYECLTVNFDRDVRFFWACRKAGRAREPLTPGSALWQALHGYTEAIAREMGTEFTNQLILNFALKVQITKSGVIQQILPNDVSRISSRFALSMSKPDFDKLVRAYQSRLNQRHNGVLTTSNAASATITKPPTVPKQCYFLMEELRELLLVPCLELLLLRKGIKSLGSDIITLLSKLIFCDEVLFDVFDPLPAFWAYFVVFVWSTFMA